MKNIGVKNYISFKIIKKDIITKHNISLEHILLLILVMVDKIRIFKELYYSDKHNSLVCSDYNILFRLIKYIVGTEQYKYKCSSLIDLFYSKYKFHNSPMTKYIRRMNYESI